MRCAADAGQLDPGTGLDLAVDLIWGPVQNRWLFREGPLTAEFTDALGGLAQASRRRTDT